jgi:hypothetical protein
MNAFREFDRVLRGEPLLPGGPTVDLRALFVVNLLLAIGYGCCMGSFGITGRSEPEYRQILASAVKVPVLFFLTLAVTFPSLYVFNTLLGTRLRIIELTRILSYAMAVLFAVLAALGPIVAFFSATTIHYPFILLLNVGVFTVSGLFGVSFLFRTLTLLLNPPPALEQPTSTLPCKAIGSVFYIWVIVFALVGTQMGWVLRPFVGSPFLEFTWFRPREASFFEAILKAVRQLFGGM